MLIKRLIIFHQRVCCYSAVCCFVLLKEQNDLNALTYTSCVTHHLLESLARCDKCNTQSNVHFAISGYVNVSLMQIVADIFQLSHAGN
jgi:hypothetical protein